MQNNDIALIGLAVMGQSLALNMARNGFKVVVYNRTWSTTEAFMTGPAQSASIIAARDLTACVASLCRPRKIFLMVQAGAAVDAVLSELTPLLEPGDIVMDGGNSHYPDTERRMKSLAEKDIHFLGVGVSGGEKGALLGPSIMPGGTRQAWDQVAPILTAIAAKAKDGEPCTAFMGGGGAGHFVKMVHNGIEYADMQLIAEVYDLLRRGAGLEAPAIADIFAQWNKEALASFLIEITAQVLRVADGTTAAPLVDMILDRAGSKGTGKWTTEAALELSVPTPSINAAVEARLLSASTDARTLAEHNADIPHLPQLPDNLIAKLAQALYAAKLIAYAQGFGIFRAAENTWQWGLDAPAIARSWRAGCIIRAVFLDDIAAAFTATPNLPNLLIAPEFAQALTEGQSALREIVSWAALAGVPVPALAASLAYFDSARSKRLPANLIQAQRDAFGAHQFERIDRPGKFHAQWGIE